MKKYYYIPLRNNLKAFNELTDTTNGIIRFVTKKMSIDKQQQQEGINFFPNYRVTWYSNVSTTRTRNN